MNASLSRLHATVACWLALAMTLPLLGADPGKKAVGRVKPIEALTPEQLERAGLRPEESAGLFIGVNDFNKDSGLAPLRFAVDDAVDLAHLFAIERGLIAPEKVWLALAGKPFKPESQQRLAQLQDRRANLVSPNFTEAIQLITRVPRQTGRNGMLVFHISSHGFDESEEAYVMMSDSFRDALATTAIRVRSISDAMRGINTPTAAPRRLLLIDACRNKAVVPPGGARAAATPNPAGEAFQRAFLASQGQAILSAADVGKYSYEEEKIGQGLFTYYLLEGLRGGVPGDESGLIRLRPLSDWVGQQVQEATRERELPQVISQTLTPESALIPLAYSSLDDVAFQARKEKALEVLNLVSRRHREVVGYAMLEQIESALGVLRGRNLDRVLRKVEKLDATDTDDVEQFATWWTHEGVKLGAAPAPVVATVVVAPPVETPPANPSPAPAPVVLGPTPTLLPAAPAIATGGGTAFALIAVGNEQVPAASRDQVVEMRGIRKRGQLHPRQWQITYYDPGSTFKAVTVNLLDGRMTKVSRPLRVLESTVGAYGGSHAFDRAKLTVDSDRALQIAAAEPNAKNFTLTTSEMLLQRDKAGAPVWKVTLWAQRPNRARDEFELGEMQISGLDGSVIESDLHPDRAE